MIDFDLNSFDSRSLPPLYLHLALFEESIRLNIERNDPRIKMIPQYLYDFIENRPKIKNYFKTCNF